MDGNCTPVQVNLFEAFGGIEKSWGNSDNNRLAITKERDAVIGLDNHGFRYFDPVIGRYISNDPIAYEGGFNLYVYCTNDPVNKFDPHGLKKRVVVSGGVNEDIKKDKSHDKNWRNFVKAAELDMKKAKKESKGEDDIEWHVQKSSYEKRAKNDGKEADEYTKEIETIADKLGVKLRWYNDKDELKKNINTSPEGKSREGNDKISDFKFYGHGMPGRLQLKYKAEEGTADSFEFKDIAQINKSAFSEGERQQVMLAILEQRSLMSRGMMLKKIMQRTKVLQMYGEKHWGFQ